MIEWDWAQLKVEAWAGKAAFQRLEHTHTHAHTNTLTYTKHSFKPSKQNKATKQEHTCILWPFLGSCIQAAKYEKSVQTHTERRGCSWRGRTKAHHSTTFHTRTRSVDRIPEGGMAELWQLDHHNTNQTLDYIRKSWGNLVRLGYNALLRANQFHIVHFRQAEPVCASTVAPG